MYVYIFIYEGGRKEATHAEIYFKKLSHVIVGAGYKIYSTNQKVRDAGKCYTAILRPNSAGQQAGN